MSKQNKANKSNYVQAGRLTPDEMARARERQGRGSAEIPRKQVIGKAESPDAPAPTPPRSEPEE